MVLFMRHSNVKHLNDSLWHRICDLNNSGFSYSLQGLTLNILWHGTGFLLKYKYLLVKDEYINGTISFYFIFNNKDSCCILMTLCSTAILLLEKVEIFIKMPGSNHNDKWASSWDYGTYRIGEQRRLMRDCGSAQSHQSFRCSHT